jgi:hypothetical protein
MLAYGLLNAAFLAISSYLACIAFLLAEESPTLSEDEIEI